MAFSKTALRAHQSKIDARAGSKIRDSEEITKWGGLEKGEEEKNG